MYTDGRHAKGWSICYVHTHSSYHYIMFGMHPVHKVARDATGALKEKTPFLCSILFKGHGVVVAA